MTNKATVRAIENLGSEFLHSLCPKRTDKLAAAPKLDTRLSLDIDMSANPGMDPIHFRRRLIVLEPQLS